MSENHNAFVDNFRPWVEIDWMMWQQAVGGWGGGDLVVELKNTSNFAKLKFGKDMMIGDGAKDYIHYNYI